MPFKNVVSIGELRRQLKVPYDHYCGVVQTSFIKVERNAYGLLPDGVIVVDMSFHLGL